MKPATCTTPTAWPGSPTSNGEPKKTPDPRHRHRTLARSIARLRALPDTPAQRKRLDRLAADLTTQAAQTTEIPHEQWDFFYYQ